MAIKTLDKADLKDKKVLLRIDINAPVAHGIVLDGPRFKAASETINYLLGKKAKLVIIAHQGRKGDPDFLPLEQHAKILSKLTKQKIMYFDSLFGDIGTEIAENMKPGQAVLLKNVREFEDETNIDIPNNRYVGFCKHFDIFVNDSFSVCHRDQGSIIIPPKFLPSYVGLSMQRELEAISKFTFKKTKKNVFLIGGAKIDDYLPIFDVLKNKKNIILASGVLGDLFLVGLNHNLGYEQEWLETHGYSKLLPELMRIYSKHKKQIILPVDFAVDAHKRIELPIEKFPQNYKIADLGTKSIVLFKKHLKGANAIFMKGPLGFSEFKEFSKATVEILKEISRMTKAKKTFSLLGGGHLTTSIQKYKIPDNFSYISLSGGALIKAISGEKLPGIEILKKSK